MDALRLASANGHEHVVRVLLENERVDPNLPGLVSAARSRRVQIENALPCMSLAIPFAE